MDREERLRIELPVYCDEKDQILKTKDVSEGGCYIRTDEPLPEGTKVHLVFYADKKPVLVKGVVRHSVKGGPEPGMGISFTEVPPEYRKLIKQLKRKKSPWRWFQKADTVSSFAKNILLILFMLAFFFGAASEKIKTYRLERKIHALESRTGQKIITMIHREVSVGLFGIPVKRYIKVKDAEKILSEIRKTPPNKPIGLVLHTPGGILFSAFQIAKALKEHKGKVTVYVPHYAMSGGTLIALAADEIVMDPNAILGPVDPQMMLKGEAIPAVSVVNIRRYKPLKELEDQTLILYDQARKAVRQVQQMVSYLLSCNDGNGKKCEKIFEALVKGTVTHDYPVTFEKAKELGLPVRNDVPKEIYSLLLIK